MQIVLNNNIKPFTIEKHNKQAFIDKYSDITKNYVNKTVSQSLFPVVDNISPEHTVYHANYLEYLEKCWAYHRGAVLTPDIMWYTLLNEIALIISESPETYRPLFTDKAEKHEIVVLSNSLVELPLDAIINELTNLVPNSFANIFLPSFSTSTPRSVFAIYSAFADTVSPYYSYSMKLCGIPEIRLEGNVNDWVKVYIHYSEIVHKLLEIENDFVYCKYYSTVSSVLFNIIRVLNLDLDANEYFKDMFRLERCGSGSQTEVEGWFASLFRRQPDIRFVKNYSSHISKVEYKQLDTGKNYVMKNGLFSSNDENSYFKPQFSNIIYEKRQNEVRPLENLFYIYTR